MPRRSATIRSSTRVLKVILLKIYGDIMEFLVDLDTVVVVMMIVESTALLG